MLGVALRGAAAYADAPSGPAVGDAPLVLPGTAPANPGVDLARLDAARRALEFGLPVIAEDLLEDLAKGDLPDTKAREQVLLSLATAQLENGETADARATLGTIVGLPSPAWRLRMGLVELRDGHADSAKDAIAGLTSEQLAPEDRGWLTFVQAWLTENGGELAKAQSLYTQAEGEAVSAGQKARFILARQRASLLQGGVTEQQLAAFRSNFEQFLGTTVGVGYTRQYAVALERLGRKAEAVALLKRALPSLPGAQATAADEFRVLIGLIDGADGASGRAALVEQVSKGTDRQLQLVALQMLARAATSSAARGALREQIAAWVSATPPHPIQPEILLVQAELALADKDYPVAETAARLLLDRFPASELKVNALALLTRTAWARVQYYNAAVYASQARAALPDGRPDRAQLGVVMAEAYFRFGDYRDAADAYTAVIAERPPGVPRGNLLFQRVLSDVRLDRVDEAAKALDAMAGDPECDLLSRWRAEWNVARAMLADNRPKDALARVDALLSGPEDAPATANVPPELWARLGWLQVRLGNESGAYAQALQRADALGRRLDGNLGAKLPDTLKGEIAAGVALLGAEALLRLDRSAEGMQRLRDLRTNYPRTDAAASSYFTEANYYAARNQLVDAQRLLTELADNFKSSPWAAYALYAAALNAERRGQVEYINDAYRLLERLVNDYPNSDLFFYARLKQADLLRKLSKFAPAQQIYESLSNQFRGHTDVLMADLALAYTHNAQAANDPSHAETAASIFERLQDLAGAPVDLRAEAAFNLGHNLVQRGRADRAREVWWLAVQQFLLDDTKAAQLGATGRYWMSRTVLELGSLLERNGQLDDARSAYELILQRELPGVALVRSRLAALEGRTTTSGG